MDIINIVSIALGVLLLIGLLLGVWRSWQKSLIRTGLIVVSMIGALLLAPKISEVLMSKFVNGLVLTVFGLTVDFESIIGEIAGDLVSEGSALTNLATAILNIVIKLVAFLLVFVVLFIVTLIIYYIIVAIIAGRQKSKSVGKFKPRPWERLIGGGVGMLGSLVICLALFTPVFGVMNVCDKFLDQENSNVAGAYNSSFVCGKFYKEDKQIGQVETYLEQYDKLRKAYKNSFAGIVFTYTGIDAIGKASFNNLSTVTQNGLTVSFTDEFVNFGLAYNLYKENFVENKFDIAQNNSIEAVQKLYNVAKNSNVMKSIIVDLVPKMASKWTNGEKFLGMNIPANGDMKDILIEVLDVFDTTEFSVLDKNINVLLDAIRVANKHEIISSVNNGSELLDVIDNGTFIKDEINTLAESSEFRRALPNILTTTMKIVYNSVLGDPGDALDQEFTQTQLLEVVWSDEAEVSQTIVTNMLQLFNSEDFVDSLDDLGLVLDSARTSKILSKPIRVLMKNFIEEKVELSSEVKPIIVDAFNEENWNAESGYSYTNLFKTVQVTAKVANDIGDLKFTDIPLEDLLENDSDGKVKETIENAISSGILTDLVGDVNKAQVYEELIMKVLDKSEGENPVSIPTELKAGQVVADIINKSDENNSMFGENKQDEANTAINDLSQSTAVMEVLGTEADKVEAGQDSKVKDYIDGMNENDKLALENAIKAMDEGVNQDILAILFDVTLD